MVFEIDLTNITNICKLYNTPVDYAYFKRSLEERIRSNIDSTSARHTLAVLDEFGKEHLLDTLMSGNTVQIEVKEHKDKLLPTLVTWCREDN